MRLLLCANHLPPACDIGSLEPVNFSHTLSFPPRITKDFISTMFSHGLNPVGFKGAFVPDVEHPAMFGPRSLAGFDEGISLNLRVNAKARETFPTNEFLGYDVVGGHTLEQAMQNVKACRRTLLQLDGAGTSMYCTPGSRLFKVADHVDPTLGAYRAVCQPAKPEWSVGIWLWGDLSSPKVFAQSCREATDRKPDWIGIWQAAVYHLGDVDQATKVVQQEIEILQEVCG